MELTQEKKIRIFNNFKVGDYICEIFNNKKYISKLENHNSIIYDVKSINLNTLDYLRSSSFYLDDINEFIRLATKDEKYQLDCCIQADRYLSKEECIELYGGTFEDNIKSNKITETNEIDEKFYINSTNVNKGALVKSDQFNYIYKYGEITYFNYDYFRVQWFTINNNNIHEKCYHYNSNIFKQLKIYFYNDKNETTKNITSEPKKITLFVEKKQVIKKEEFTQLNINKTKKLSLI